MNPNKVSKATPFESTYDLAEWIEVVVKKSYGNCREVDCSVKGFLEMLREEPEEDWKRCRKCRKIYLVSYFHEHLKSRDGYRAECKGCRRRENNIGARRRRTNKKMMQRPGDLAEIQKHRAAAGLKPLPFGSDSPKPGRPGSVVWSHHNEPNAKRAAVGSVKYTLEEVNDG
jgi:hypothetical protein